MPPSANCLRRCRYLANSARLGTPDYSGRMIIPRERASGAICFDLSGERLHNRPQESIDATETQE
jgi:hypothetical protein